MGSFQLLTPKIFPMVPPFSTALSTHSATSAREILKPKGGRWPSRTRNFPVRGLSVSWGGRRIVQSSSLFRKTSSIPEASITTSRKNNRPKRYVGGKIESLNKNATDTTTTRRTLACSIAPVSTTAKRRRRSASALDLGDRKSV